MIINDLFCSRSSLLYYSCIFLLLVLSRRILEVIHTRDSRTRFFRRLRSIECVNRSRDKAQTLQDLETWWAIRSAWSRSDPFVPRSWCAPQAERPSHRGFAWEKQRSFRRCFGLLQKRSEQHHMFRNMLQVPNLCQRGCDLG